MKQVAKWLKSQLSRIDGSEDSGEDYVALESRKYDHKLQVRTFALTEFEDVKKISKCVREGQSVVLVDLKPLKEKDIIDLKRSVNKLKALTQEVQGDIAGLSGDWVVMTPGGISVERQTLQPSVETQESAEMPLSQ